MDKRIIEETPSTEVLNDDWFIKDSPTGGTSKILGSNLKEIISGDVEDSIDKILDSIAPEWSSTSTYGFDAYVIYEGELWRCFKDTGSTVGEFKTSEWIKAVTSGYITHVVNKIADRFVASNPPFMRYSYSVGDMVFYSEPYHDEQLYVCNTDLPQGESTFNPEHWDVVYTVAGLSKYLMDKIAEAGQIDDVQVKTTGDYESVVDENKVAKIDLSNILIEKSVPNLPQSIATFNDGSDNPLKSLTASIVPVQDLHGYDSPWAGGAGKNKLPLTVDLLKSVNGGANTWNNNSKEINGITYTIQVDDNGNVIGINANGTATSNSIIYLMGASSPQIELSGQSVIISLSGFSKGAYKDNSWHDILSTSTESTVTLNGAVSQVWGQINNGVTVNNIVSKPMIRLASVTDATFAPYSNICPISGWDEEVITVTDDLQNPTVTHTTTIPFTDSQGNPVEVYGGSADVVNGVVTPCPYYASYNGEQLTGEWISDRDVYSPNTTPTIGAQVVNIGATSTPFSVQPTSIKSLDGENNVFASTGDVTKLEYIANATDVIANLEARVTALENA